MFGADQHMSLHTKECVMSLYVLVMRAAESD